MKSNSTFLGSRVCRKSPVYHIAAMLLLVGVSGCQPQQNDSAISETEATLADSPLGPASTGDAPGFATRLLWGDLHVHSNLSFDAFSFGNRSLDPDQAYSFASGLPVQSSGGLMATLQRPLDFLMVSDHAEYMGVMRGLAQGNQSLLDAPFARRWQQFLDAGDLPAVVKEFRGSIQKTLEYTNVIPADFETSVWEEIIGTAEKHNKPGKFTAFAGYEWTSMIDGKNLHRNVVLADGPEITGLHKPFSAIDGNDPEMLWNHLHQYAVETGGQVLAIPHHGNPSDGLMFAESRMNGEPITPEYARKRRRWEPLYEVTQIKGDSEAHPLLSPQDPFADFENWDQTNIAMDPRNPETQTPALAHEYARPALKIGLQIARKVGTNPFQFGMIGSTDSHTSLATADSDNFFGKFLDSEPSINRLSNKMGGVLWANRKLTASGYAAVWSRSNTRKDIFDALKRREVYASTGPRISVRFFGGWNLEETLLKDPDFAAKAYLAGVPMGGVLTAPAEGEDAPVFLIRASKDPEGANLDRVQIIKGWLTEDGTAREQVYDVAWSDNRQKDVAEALPELPSTVNLRTASYDDSTGSVALAALWSDPDFDRRLSAFYYLRVLQIKTPRWTTYDAIRYGADLPPDLPGEIQERAYTSPIWYTPQSPATR